MFYLHHLPGFFRMLHRRWQFSKRGFHRYAGDAEQICEQIVNDCWNGEFFQTSTGHFCEFWTRDFGMCVEALLKLGWKKEVNMTFEYAMARFADAGRVTTNIPKDGKPADFPNFAVDSLPFFVRSLRLAGAKQLLKEHKVFLNKEIERYYNIVFDSKTSLVHTDRSFSSMKDLAKRKSSTYDNSMLFMLGEDLAALHLSNPFAKRNIVKAMENHLWNGRFFEEDMRKTGIVTGDANTFPFWCNVFTSRKMAQSCIAQICKHGLDKPFPLKYTVEPKQISKMLMIEPFTGGYERDAIWMHLGLCYMDVVWQYDKTLFSEYVDQLTWVIEKNKTFLEVFESDGTPFRTPFYVSDEGMLWA
ncbi:hypothetical protein HY488_01900, partial [Candidatus Woesearchaeota archaeon]|nr:hypothetical protein [Candidatus Woesearchaeota archaeon]